MSQQHQPGGQSALSNITQLGDGATVFNLNDLFVTNPVEVRIAYRLALWLKVEKVGMPLGLAKVTFFVQLAGEEDGDDWYDLASAVDTIPEGFTIRGLDVPDEGLSMVLPYQNPGGIQRVRIRMEVEGMTPENHLIGELAVGSLR